MNRSSRASSSRVSCSRLEETSCRTESRLCSLVGILHVSASVIVADSVTIRQRVTFVHADTNVRSLLRRRACSGELGINVCATEDLPGVACTINVLHAVVVWTLCDASDSLALSSMSSCKTYRLHHVWSDQNSSSVNGSISTESTGVVAEETLS